MSSLAEQRATAREAIRRRTAGASEQSVAEIVAELDAHVGMAAVKAQVETLIAQAELAKKREALGITSAATPTRHMIFVGPPGTGKTTVAKVVARAFHALGFLPTSNVLTARRNDFVGQWQGHTAEQTAKVLAAARGGVLFIDEAYSLVKDSNDAFGQEAVDRLLVDLEDSRGDFVCILAGYPTEMATFLESNSGLASRFPITVEFPGYNASELAEIVVVIAERNGAVLPVVSIDRIADLCVSVETSGVTGDRAFDNARGCRSMVEKAEANRDARLLKMGDDIEDLDREALLTLEPEDFELPDLWASLIAKQPGAVA